MPTSTTRKRDQTNVSDAVDAKQPVACTDEELRDFERLVREGFDGSDEGLPERIGQAAYLAYHHAADDTLVAIAGLKAPDRRSLEATFRKAASAARPDDYTLELGWVYVDPGFRGAHLATDLCRRLLARAAGAGVFARTRPHNAPMIHILGSLGFVRSGEPYPRPERNEMLALFLRPPTARTAAGPGYGR